MITIIMMTMIMMMIMIMMNSNDSDAMTRNQNLLRKEDSSATMVTIIMMTMIIMKMIMMTMTKRMRTFSAWKTAPPHLGQVSPPPFIADVSPGPSDLERAWNAFEILLLIFFLFLSHLPIFCIARMAKKTSLPLNHSRHLKEQHCKQNTNCLFISVFVSIHLKLFLANPARKTSSVPDTISVKQV